MAISKEILDEIKLNLEKKRESIFKELGIISADLTATHDSGDHTTIDVAATLEESAIISSSVMEEEEKILYAIEEALIRIDKGTYGVCGCKAEIPEGRLRAMPYADKCMSCASSR